MKRILVTGAGGFVGAHLVRKLQENPENQVYANVHSNNLSIKNLLPAEQVIVGDLTDNIFAQDLIQQSKPDVAYHLAALSVVHNSMEHAVSVMTGNTAISFNFFEAIRQMSPHTRCVAICSANVYGAVQDTTKPVSETTPLRPLNPYAVSKVTQEMIALEYYLAHGLDMVILRPFNHTGPGQTTDFVIPRLAEQFIAIEQKRMQPTITVGNLDSVRDFTDVRDMVAAYVLAAEKGETGEIYNIGSGEGHTIREIISLFESLLKIKVEVVVNEEYLRERDVKILVADATKFRQLTHWQPKIALLQTISDILESYRHTNHI